jgi:hypothetical protein
MPGAVPGDKQCRYRLPIYGNLQMPMCDEKRETASLAQEFFI